MSGRTDAAAAAAAARGRDAHGAVAGRLPATAPPGARAARAARAPGGAHAARAALLHHARAATADLPAAGRPVAVAHVLTL